jgi:alkylation response protein AidB-like acyl-CoA dehydrogenase
MQAVNQRLARMKLRLEGARLLVYRSAWLLDRGERASAAAALAKWNLSEASLANAIDAFRLRGGAGYLREAALGHDIDDALGATMASGTSDVLQNLVARWLGV